jgi:anti-anti-sigma factor
MENVSAEVTKEGLRVSLIGHIDSSNAEAVEQAILPIRAAHPEGDFLFDGEKLDYISSAGLRMILRFAKKEKPFA